MTFLNLAEAKEELVIFLRNNDVLSTTVRGVTTDTDDTFSGDDAETNFIISRTNVKNIRSLSIGADAQSLGTHYTVDYNYDNSGTVACRITFLTAPATGTDNITLSYDYGTDKIYPDYPRDDLKITNYPRVAVDILGGDSAETVLGAGMLTTNLSFSIIVFDDSEKNIDTIIGLIRTAFLNNKKNFFYLRFITIIGLGPTIPSPSRGDKISSRTVDLMAPLNIEE